MTYPRAILHFDGDSFFASVEQAMNYTLRGRPVVTGAERGAATALSIEAKRLGLHRGMSIREIREKCPEVVVVASNYTAYSLYARRMYRIVGRYSAKVEEYSIDECFADITGLTELYLKTYEEIALMIKGDLERSLGITFGVGLGPSKVVAKIGSKHNKPGGFTPIPQELLPQFLETLPIGSLWGVGPAMARTLQAEGVVTALDFARKDEFWLRSHKVAKPYREIWFELRGGCVKELEHMVRAPASIIKTRTFAPPNKDRAFIFSQLSKNIERACERARTQGLLCGVVGVMLKNQEFLYRNSEVMLRTPTNDPAEILKIIEKEFDRMFVPSILYRATGVSLRSLVRDSHSADLFGETAMSHKSEKVLLAVDTLNKRYGKETVHLASSLRAVNNYEPNRQKNVDTPAKALRTTLEQKKKTIDLPFLGMVR